MGKIFDTHGCDSELRVYDGTECEVIGPVDESLYDKADVGPMFVIRLANGKEIDAFEDEIREE